MAPRPLHEIVEPGWAEALGPVAGKIAEMGDFLRAEIAAGRTYLPAGQNVLRAFQQPFDDVRVLIVGQDPYPTPGHAVGLSFSVAPEVRPLPGSLINIYRELNTDLGLPQPSDGDLTPWTQQGCCCSTGRSPRLRASRRHIAGRVGRRSPNRRSGRWRRAASPWCPSCGAATPATCVRCSGTCPRWSPRTPPHVGGPRLLRLTAVQQGERPAGPAGGQPVDWRLP